MDAVRLHVPVAAALPREAAPADPVLDHLLVEIDAAEERLAARATGGPSTSSG